MAAELRPRVGDSMATKHEDLGASRSPRHTEFSSFWWEKSVRREDDSRYVWVTWTLNARCSNTDCYEISTYARLLDGIDVVSQRRAAAMKLRAARNVLRSAMKLVRAVE